MPPFVWLKNYPKLKVLLNIGLFFFVIPAFDFEAVYIISDIYILR